MSLRSMLTFLLANAVVTTAVAQPAAYPGAVEAQLRQLASWCAEGGGKARLLDGAVTRASLTDDTMSDHIIWADRIACDAPLFAVGGVVGKVLILVPASGKAIKSAVTTSWRLIGDGPSTVELTGGFECNEGKADSCVHLVRWNETEFANISASVHLANATQARPASIVGDWSESPAACSSPTDGMVRIGPMSLTTDEMSCTFRSVTRSGATVSWFGACNEGGKTKAANVSATERGGRLTITFDGGSPWASLTRCPRR